MRTFCLIGSPAAEKLWRVSACSSTNAGWTPPQGWSAADSTSRTPGGRELTIDTRSQEGRRQLSARSQSATGRSLRAGVVQEHQAAKVGDDVIALRLSLLQRGIQVGRGCDVEFALQSKPDRAVGVPIETATRRGVARAVGCRGSRRSLNAAVSKVRRALPGCGRFGRLPATQGLLRAGAREEHFPDRAPSRRDDVCLSASRRGVGRPPSRAVRPRLAGRAAAC
jgi:hypothetical protein